MVLGVNSCRLFRAINSTTMYAFDDSAVGILTFVRGVPTFFHVSVLALASMNWLCLLFCVVRRAVVCRAYRTPIIFGALWLTNMFILEVRRRYLWNYVCKKLTWYIRKRSTAASK